MISFTNTAKAFYIKSITVEHTSGVVKTITTTTFPETYYTAEIGKEFTSPTATVKDADGKSVENAVVTYSSSNSSVASVDANTGKVTVLSMGATVIKATFNETDSYDDSEGSYTLRVADSKVKKATDHINLTNLNITVNNVYKKVNMTSWTTGAQYYANTEKYNTEDQFVLNENADPDGLIVCTTSVGTLKELRLTHVYGNSADGYNFVVYGSHTPFTSTTDWNTIKNEGTQIGTHHFPNQNTEGPTTVTVTKGYEYFAVTSLGGATRVNDMEVVWNTTPTTKDVETVTLADEGYVTYVVEKAIDVKATLANNTNDVNIHVYKVPQFTAREVATVEFGLHATNSESEDVIPANTPVILYGTKGSHNLVVYIGSETPTVSGNLLKGSINGEVKAGDNDDFRVLQKVNGVYGFHKLKSGRTVGKEGQRKAYLDESEAVKALDDKYKETNKAKGILVWGEGETPVPTGITTVNTEAKRFNDGRIFNLSGQYVGRDMNSLPKGIYIINGKKVCR